MTRRHRRPGAPRAIGVALALALSVTACRPAAPPSRAPGAASAEFFPLVKGARWIYDLDLVVTSTKIEVLAKGRLPGLREAARNYLQRFPNGPNADRVAELATAP